MAGRESDQVMVIGAGPAGLTAALELVRRHTRGVTVLERDDVVGGIARTVVYRGFRFDIGGHRFFTKNDAIRSLWHEILGERMLRVQRLSRIYYGGRFFDYPLRPLQAARNLGAGTSLAVAASYARARIRPRVPEVSFEDWVVNRFGRRLFEIFFKTYTEKVWGIPTGEISADWAAQRIRGLSLREAVLQPFRRGRGGTIRTLTREFDYPELGPGQMWETVAEMVGASGGRVLTGHRVERVLHDGRRVRAVQVRADGGLRTVEGASFLSSMPMRDLVEALSPAAPSPVAEAARGLRYRDFILVALIVGRPDLFPDNWIYIHAPDVGVGRIQNFRNWSPYLVPDPAYNCLGMEYFCDAGDALWNAPDSALIEQAGREIEALGLCRRGEIEDAVVVRMEKTYPTYDRVYRERVDTLRAYLERFANLQLIGRNGMHKYNNQDHSMLTGILAARNLQGERHDLWAVNTDAEYLEMKTLS